MVHSLSDVVGLAGLCGRNDNGVVRRITSDVNQRVAAGLWSSEALGKPVTAVNVGKTVPSWGGREGRRGSGGHGARRRTTVESQPDHET